MQNRRSIFLYPFSLIYGLITEVRNFLYNVKIIKSHGFSVPVICVGNISVGGTGKTPHTEYLAELLREKFRVAVLSRGYRRKSSGFLLTEPDSKVMDVGDEPVLISRKYPDITVAVDSNRVRGVKNILTGKPDTGVILLDDGFQHRRVTPGFTILLSDYNRLMVRDKLLPYGNLRESKHNMSRADMIIITRSPRKISPMQKRIITKEIHKAPYQNLYFTSVKYYDPLPVFVDTDAKSNKDLQKINNAWNKLESEERVVFTTEKDAMRLRDFADIKEPLRSSFYYIPMGIHFLNDSKEEFDNLILDYVRKNIRNNRVSESKWYK
jgi:tetraacyldisaccharide 4'-kinase